MSAIVTGAPDKSGPVHLFDDDLSEEESVDDEILLLSDFGPSSFDGHQEELEDEENDVQLWLDAIESIKEWQENKILKQKLKLSHR